MKRILLGVLLLTTALPLTISCKNSSNPAAPAPTPTSWAGFTNTMTYTTTYTPTITPTLTITPSFTITPSPTATTSPTITPTNLSGYTSTPTPSFTPTSTFTYTSTYTYTYTATYTTPTFTPTITWTFVASPTWVFSNSWPVTHPNGLALLGNSSSGTLFVAAGENSVGAQVLSFKISNGALSGGVLGTWTQWGSTPLVSPEGVAVNQTTNQVYVVDSGDGGNGTVYVFNSDGTTVTSWSSWTGAPVSAFNDPTGIAVDSTGTTVYVADTGHNTLEVFDQNGNYISQWSTGTGTDLSPVAVACGAGTTIAAVDDGNASGSATINVYSSASLAASITAAPNADIFGLAFDQTGNLFAADTSLDPNGSVEYYSAGVEQFVLTGGTGTNAFVSPDGVVYDTTGTLTCLYVSDYGNGSNGLGSIEILSHH